MSEFDEYESLPEASALTHMIAGSLAGVGEHVAMYPVDSIKTRLQSLVPAANGRRGLVATGMAMIRSEGRFSPYRGVWTMVAGAGPAHALYFASYERLKVILSPAGSANSNPLAQSAAASVATVLHDGVMTPAEVVKQRLQMYNSPYRSMTHCILSVFRAEGMGAFYRSYGTQLVMNIPFQCAHFVVYEAMQNVSNPDRSYNPLCHVVSGGVSGAVAAAVTTPLDVCKTLLNTQEAGALERSHQTQIRGLGNAFRLVYRLGGMRGFFQGMAARIIYQAPSTAICWSVYEFFKHFLTSGDSGKADVLSSVTYEKLPTGGSTGGGGGGSSSGGLNSDGAVIVLSAGGPGHVLIKEDILPAA